MNHGNLPPGANLQLTREQMQIHALREQQRRLHRMNPRRSQPSQQASRRLQSLQQASRMSKPSNDQRTLRETNATTERAGGIASAVDQLQFPDSLPSEVVLNILRCLHVRTGGKTVFLRPKKSLDEAYLSLDNIDIPVAARTYPYNEKSDDQPPMVTHTSPNINLLLVSKVFRDEGYNYFFRHNVFSFSDNDHVDDVLRLLDPKKRSLIRHVSFESQWGLQLRLDEHIDRMIASDFDLDWGNYMTSALSDLPNIKSVTLRVRCTTHYGDFLARYGAFEWELTNGGGKVWIKKDKEVLAYVETRDRMRAWVAGKVETNYAARGMERYLPVIKLVFVWNETREYKGNERVWSLDEIERDPAKFGLDPLQERVG